MFSSSYNGPKELLFVIPGANCGPIESKFVSTLVKMVLEYLITYLSSEMSIMGTVACFHLLPWLTRYHMFFDWIKYFFDLKY